MCTRFIYNGSDIITAFNFDIDTHVWKHKVFKDKSRFYIGIMRPDGLYHSYHGVNKNGNAGTLLYVHGNKQGEYEGSDHCIKISDLTEKFINAELSLDGVLDVLKSKKVVYAEDATMQAMLTDISGRALIIEPGIGYRLEYNRYSLITNYSLLDPKSTEEFILPGDDRYKKTQLQLEKADKYFSTANAFKILNSVSQKGIWATRVSFAYSVNEQAVYYTENNEFDIIKKISFSEMENKL